MLKASAVPSGRAHSPGQTPPKKRRVRAAPGSRIKKSATSVHSSIRIYVACQISAARLQYWKRKICSAAPLALLGGKEMKLEGRMRENGLRLGVYTGDSMV